MDAQHMTEAMREAIAKALHPYVSTDDHETACKAVLGAVKNRLIADLPALMEHALKQPENVTVLTTALVVPLLQEIEDGLNDEQNNPKTMPGYQPGLRRAATFVRQIRRAITEGTTP